MRATLATIADAGVAAPATIVIGEVAAQNLRWFESRPLFGRRIVVTRPRGQAGELADALHQFGAEVLEAPSIEIVDPADGGRALSAAIARIPGGAYDWIVFTSANAVHRVFAHIPDTRVLGPAMVAAIGPGSAAALAEYRVVADVVPEAYVAESLLEALPAPASLGRSVLLPRAAEARDVLPQGLESKGWQVDVVPAYRTVAAGIDDSLLDAAATADAITFTSSSTVQHYVAAAGLARIPPIVACIGPITAATAREHGLDVAIEASTHTVDGLVEALVARLSRG